MGGISTGFDGVTKTPFTGGVPRRDWTGLLSPTNEHVFLMQLRPTNQSASMKVDSTLQLKMSTDPQFNKGSNLVLFTQDIFKELKVRGLDSITYLPHPTDPNEVLSVITDHGRYSLLEVRDLAKEFTSKWDKYDKQNDFYATSMLLSSLHPDLKADIRRKLSQDDPFTVLWMILIEKIQSTSTNRWALVKKRLEARKVTDYAGQNVEMLAHDFVEDGKELEIVNQYDHNLTKIMLKAFIQAGGDSSNPADPFLLEYRQPLVTISMKLEQALRKIAYEKDPNTYMANENLTFTDICAEAERLYIYLKNDNRWLPALAVPDATAPPPKYGANLAVTPGSDNSISSGVLSQLTALLSQLVPSTAPTVNNKPKGNCHACGSPDHWANRCPNRNSSSSTNSRSKGGKATFSADTKGKGHGAKNSGRNMGKPVSWKYTKTTDVVEHNGRRFNWCQHCKAYTTSHTTATHRVPPPGNSPTTSNPPTTANLAANNSHLIPNPRAYLTTKQTNKPPTNLFPNKSFTATYWLEQFIRMVLYMFTTFLNSPFLLLAASMLNIWLTLDMHVQFMCTIPPFKILIVPIFWVLLGIASVSVEHAFGKAKIPRAFRRAHRKFFRHKNERQRIFKYPKQYRKNLRDAGLCFARAPTEQERLMTAQRIRGFNKSVQVQRTAERRGKAVKATKMSDTVPCYRPVPGSFGRGTCSFTKRQQAALLKIINTSFLRAVTTKTPALPPYAYVSTTKKKFKTLNHQPANTFDLIWDSGASLSISNDRNDFVGAISTTPGQTISGISEGLLIEGHGTVAWHFMDKDNKMQTLLLPAYYVPTCNQRLLSTASVSQVYPNAVICMHHLGATMTVELNGSMVNIPAWINPSNNLPTSTNLSITSFDVASAYKCTNFSQIPVVAALSTVSPTNYNLSEAEKELLRWHFRLGHISMRKVQFLMKTGVLATSESLRRLQAKSAQLTNLPKCTACQYGKQKRTPAPGKTSNVIRDKVGAITKGNLLPGQEVSVDHFKCSTRGRLFTSMGKTSDSEMYTGGALFIDHASNYVDVQLQTQPNTHETIKSKQAFELHCRDYGVLVQRYISDNGTAFTSADFTAELSRFNQTIRFAGVGAHHHNGHVERAIGTIMSISRTMLLHAAIHWPQVADPQLWPMAVKYAVFLWNHMPNEHTGLSPSDIFTRTRWPIRKYHDLHVFGCPAYILDKRISDGHKIPKWTPRSRRSIFMGLSPRHASSVPLVLNFDTGSITPQFHVVLDNWFATIATDINDLPDFSSESWASLFGESVFQFVSDDDPAEDDLTDPTYCPSVESVLPHVDQATPTAVPLTVPRSLPRVDSNTPPKLSVPGAQQSPNTTWSSPLPMTSTRTSPGLPPIDSPAPFPSLDTPIHQRESTPIQRELPTNQRENVTTLPVSPVSVPKDTPTKSVDPPKQLLDDSAGFTLVEPRRSKRSIKAPTRFGYDGSNASGYHSTSFPSYTEAHMATFDVTGSPFVYKATNDPDTLNWDQAMSIPEEKEQWLASAMKEIEDLESNGTWRIVPISDATSKIIPTMWVFRRKRTPDGAIKKFKGRFTVRGDLQEKTADDEDSYAPVAQWSSIRVMLVMSLILGWSTCSIDFANAFVQAYLKKPIWIHLPRGFMSSTTNDGDKTCLRLIKSLYGVSIAPKAWYEHVCKALFAIGFVQSSFDNCVFYRPGIMLAQWVDDFCCVYETQSHMDQFVKDLRDHGLNLTVEGTLAEFLGIKLERHENNSFKLTQRGLIEKVLKAAEMSDCNPNSTPASTTPLSLDPDGLPFNEKWQYSSIVGMLIYLATNTRMDIGFAVSQVARFTHAPKQSHGTAVKMILRYLKGTIDEGTILTPTKELTLDLYCDGDFAGLYRHDPPTEPSSAKSRIGYVILLSGCPVIWKSQLLQCVALSTTEVEYAALSISLRTFIPIKYILEEMVTKLKTFNDQVIVSRVYEDNSACFLLATIQRLTSRTRYYHAQYHWFWEHYRNGLFTIERKSTTEMLADGFTKGLPKHPFVNHRKQLQGW
jgi:hypothetical protein